jgi:hypothetical protein
MTVVVQSDLYCALPTPSMIRMISVSKLLFVNWITNLICAFLHNSDGKGAMEFIGHLAAKFGPWNFCMVCTPLAHAQTNYHVLQFGH